MRWLFALLLLVAVAAGFELGGGEPAQAGCSVLSHHPCTPGTCSVLSGHPCEPTVCSVFRHGPCVPEIIPPIGQDLRVTIYSDKSKSGPQGNEAVGSGAPSAGDSDKGSGAQEHKVNTILDLFAALRACWVPPPQDEARPGMQMSVRFAFRRDGAIIAPPRVTYASPGTPADTRDVYHDAISAALERCTPMPFSAGMGGAVAGRPIAVRYVDNRKVQ
jgi:hypothetical protein